MGFVNLINISHSVRRYLLPDRFWIFRIHRNGWSKRGIAPVSQPDSVAFESKIGSSTLLLQNMRTSLSRVHWTVIENSLCLMFLINWLHASYLCERSSNGAKQWRHLIGSRPHGNWPVFRECSTFQLNQKEFFSLRIMKWCNDGWCLRRSTNVFRLINPWHTFHILGINNRNVLLMSEISTDGRSIRAPNGYKAH